MFIHQNLFIHQLLQIKYNSTYLSHKLANFRLFFTHTCIYCRNILTCKSEILIHFAVQELYHFVYLKIKITYKKLILKERTFVSNLKLINLKFTLLLYVFLVLFKFNVLHKLHRESYLMHNFLYPELLLYSTPTLGENESMKATNLLSHISTFTVTNADSNMNAQVM